MQNRVTVARCCFSAMLLVGACVMSGCAMFQSAPQGDPYPSSPAPVIDPNAPVVDKKPTTTFPTAMAIVRVEGPKPVPHTTGTYVSPYKVVFTRNVEKPELFDRLGKLPMLTSLDTMSHLQLPDGYTTEPALLTAAANNHAGLLLIYRFDDNYADHDTVGWKTIVTAGIAPTKNLVVTSTASAVLLDAHTGYLYGSVEALSDKSQVSSCWAEDAAADTGRQEAETAAFERLVPEIEKTWGKVITQYGPANPVK